MFESTGIIHYGPEIRVILSVDQGITDYYRSLLPKSIRTNPQKHPAHVSVVRREVPPNMDVWMKHEGEAVVFKYYTDIINDETYYWLNVECERLKEIRVELGLKPYPWWRNSYHITIGNVKSADEDEVSQPDA